ncbi:MAG: pentapeptide repeat-containing protein [Alphaproteobacteria bacterium]|nr:pentapeptide repeat-containing protein [Alphaproteobacteria bacterium]
MLSALLILASVTAQAPHLTPVVAVSPDRVAVDSIKAGKRDCPNCDLSGADLTNQCVKTGNLQGATFDGAKLVLMCMSYADFRGASFRNTDLAGANLAHAKVDDADFTGADLSIASIKGTDMSRARGLTQKQLDRACADSETRVPAGLKAKTCS